VGRDFKIGLMSGVVLGFVTLIWVATRPSQSPEARMLGPSPASSQEGLPLDLAAPLPTEAQPTSPTRSESQPENSLPPEFAAPEPIDDVSSLLDRAASLPFEDRRPNEPDTTRYERDEKIATTRFHIVQRGETLSGISQQYYGSAARWQKILEANQDTITDANKISTGTKLLIPD